jgi:hypothetical protein
VRALSLAVFVSLTLSLSHFFPLRESTCLILRSCPFLFCLFCFVFFVSSLRGVGVLFLFSWSVCLMITGGAERGENGSVLVRESRAL